MTSRQFCELKCRELRRQLSQLKDDDPHKTRKETVIKDGIRVYEEELKTIYQNINRWVDG